MPLLAILSNPAAEARRATAMRPATATEKDLLRLVQMSPKARLAISGALKTRPMKVHVSGPKGEFVRFRLKEPKGYVSYALMVLSPREVVQRFQSKHGRRPTPKEARAMLGPVGARRLTIGVIGRKGPGRSELQSVLVPKARVMAVAKQYLKRAVANPRFRRNSILPAVAGGMAAGAAAALVSNALRNRGGEQVVKLPFRAGRKYPVQAIDRWVRAHGTTDQIRRWQQALAQYRRFHKGSPPNYVTYHVQTLGASRRITDLDFGVSEGKEWMAAYQVPRTSKKWTDGSSDGRYVHAHGESGIEVDVKRPVSPSRLPHRFHTPDGKFVGVIPSRNVKITDWYHG